MSIRSNSLPVGDALSLQLQEILRRNGMQAQVTLEGDQYKLHVQGHDSPVLTYNISRSQFLAMVDGGTNSANKRAYKTFINIVNKDFDCPKDYVHARNANGKITMGLHGYRVQDRGMHPYPFFRHDMPMGVFHQPPLGWTPRQQDGYHLRRIGGVLYAGSPMIPERENGRMKPGELQSGAYGFYYKGNNQQPLVQTDPLKELQGVVKPVEIEPEPAKAYRDLISSAVYFTNDKWQECLRSHNINIDANNKILYMTNHDRSYDLTDEQVRELTSNSLKGDSVYHRIDIINDVIGNDFQDKLTFDMLNSREQPDLHLKPELEMERIAKFQQQEALITPDPLQGQENSSELPYEDSVNGQSLEDHNKAWYRQVDNGREVNVGDIWVEKQEAEGEGKAKYKMSAVINGEVVSHEITQKQYDKFLALDDYHRMKMFDKVFDEVKMKTIPGQGMSFGQALMTGLGVATTLTRGAADIAHDIEHIKHPHSGPDIYVEEHHHGKVFVKPGLDTPESVASRIFEAGMNQGYRDAVMHHR